MKEMQLFSTGLAVALVLGVMTQAQEREQRRPEGPALVPPGVLERLDLTAEQKEKIAKLQKEFQEKVEPARKKLEEAIEQAKQNQDRQKAQEAQEAFRKEVGPIQQAFAEKLAQVLTEEQKRRAVEWSGRGRGGPPFNLPRILGQLDLTAEQKEKVEQLMKELGEKQETAKKKLEEAVEQAKQNQDREKVRELLQTHEREMAKLYENLLGSVQGVLSDQQKRRFADIQGRRAEGSSPGVGQMLPPQVQERLGLTPEQREKVAQLQKEMETKLKEILNDEQNRKLDELKRGIRLSDPDKGSSWRPNMGQGRVGSWPILFLNAYADQGRLVSQLLTPLAHADGMVAALLQRIASISSDETLDGQAQTDVSGPEEP